MKRTVSVLVGALALGVLASPADARRVVDLRDNYGVSFPDNDVNPRRGTLIIEDVMDVRLDEDRGRDSDVDVFNPGSACKDGSGADVNCD